jgi:hypothetical protein
MQCTSSDSNNDQSCSWKTKPATYRTPSTNTNCASVNYNPNNPHSSFHPYATTYAVYAFKLYARSSKIN